ncbi:MAG: UTP--glucose-1-phosphate uridylyltransferase [Lachnospiraceae bacterium]|nr:UTP--glucose-1-phosphate uridylyltransferase [Lachnospiraceae bacterium]
MTYEEAKQKLERFDQLHVLQYWDGLTGEQQESLLAQIDRTDFSVLKNCENRGHTYPRGVFSPMKTMELPEIEAKKDTFSQIGEQAIRDGKVAAVLLAGGMGTRLGSDNPKGMYDIGLTRPVYIFQRLIENLLDVVNRTGAWPRLFIMTSEKNNDATTAFLKEHAFFGYREDRVTFFMQDMAPASDYNGKVYMDSRFEISTSPNGNAGWFSSLNKAGLLPLVHEEGIEWMNIFAVDNVLQRIADPVFVGATIDAGVEAGEKVVRKNAPDERVGVVCLEDGRPSIVEYYELSQEMMDAKDEKGDPAYNFGVILNYLFRVDALERIARKELPLHVVEKKIPHIGADGETVKPSEPNGCKFEQLVLDMIHEFSSCLPYEVVREHEFAPIKNPTGVDSVESARELCRQNGIEL